MCSRILLVDDEPDVEGMVKLKFRKQIRKGDYEFVFARDGVDALSKLEKNPDIDIVISDINMPQMDGLTLLQHLNNLNRNLKAIIVSAYGDMDNIRAAMNKGAYDFLTKPIDFQDLHITIEKTINNVNEIKKNIEALNRAESSLQESIAQNEAIINTAQDAIITVDENEKILSSNPAARGLLGLDSKDLFGQYISELRLPSFKDIFECQTEENCDHKDICKEAVIENNTGEMIPIDISVSRFYVQDHERYTAIIRDISLHKKIEKILKDYNEELTREVNKRTQELIDLNKEKNEILGVAAHDLKNPLANIKMLAKILNEEHLGESEIQEFSSDILSTSERMFQLIKNLLDSNAIEQGKINLTFETISLNHAVEYITNVYAEHSKNKNIELISEITPNILEVEADSSALHQIIENLVSNAVKYSPYDKQVTITLKEVDESAIFSVADQGPGISEEDQKKLFKKFSRLTAQPTGGEDSTGLGLAIVKKLVELHHGDVWVESVLGEGATFFLKLPLFK
jgi:PAS domain S-box-containing protein